MSRCYACFGELTGTEAVCPYCGFSFTNYEQHNWTLRPGTILAKKYYLGRVLGEGGFGITYIAWDINLSVAVAIKEYYPSGMASRDVASITGNTVISNKGEGETYYAEGLKRYVREATVLSGLFKLPGIVSVKDFFYENSTAYIVMEYIDGISLKEYLKRRGGTIDYTETLALMKPVMASLHTIHKNNLLHRDISPDNIMIDKGGNVKLIDFGAARRFGTGDEKSMTVVLKHGYAPMEQYSRHGEQGAWTDVYALSAVMYRCITGRAPMDSIDRLREDEYVSIGKICRSMPRHIADAIDKGLAVRPSNRYSNLIEMYNDIYGSLRGRVNRKVDGVYTRLRTALIALIVVLMVGIAGGVFYSIYRSNYTANVDDGDTSQLAEVTSEVGKDQSDVKGISDTENDSGSSSQAKDSSTKELPFAVDIDNIDANFPDTVKHGIIIVREGVLDGYPDDATVEAILNAFSSTRGVWVGYEDNSGQVFVYYKGTRDGVPFAFEFQTFRDETFKLTGASKDGKKEKAYSKFFQEALDNYGL